ncbi:uncharacterized protein PgNI_07789 [Pyricularia grisea]|uniref:Uncharacterized protein n=1 Tax=Pyricularia grisea TaxID=148305 RepID=A0A6P8B1X7_PYRGI|nr:uncharacterized protein PgNI_07789 [Pyricularia grisea]TLD08856.1 hypothetical protein PgNI_07789 [Pyricularia grisea]
MIPLFLVILLFFTHFAAAGHTENFRIVKALAENAGVDLDLTGRQSYAIYEIQGKNSWIPHDYHMRLINGRVSCFGPDNCDFVGNAFHMAPNVKYRINTCGKNRQQSRNRPWKANTYYSEKADTDFELGTPNKHKWAGLTKDLTYEQIQEIAACMPDMNC